MSEAMLSMVLDIEVDRHKRELAAEFAEARKKLIPPESPRVPSLEERYYNLGLSGLAMQQSMALNQIAAQQASPYNYYNGGLFATAFGLHPPQWPF